MFMPGERRLTCFAAVAAACLGFLPALAQSTGGAGVPDQPATPESRSAAAGGQSPDIGAAYGGPFWERSNLLGDPGGVRSALAAHGLTFGLLEQAEVLGNPSGGVHQGAVVEGLLAMSIGVDTGKAGLWPGGTFNASAYQIHGRGLSLNNLDNNLNTVSSIEALRGTLLFELWYEQVLLGGKASVRAGQFAADQEFQISQYGGVFINHTFGWSTLPSADLPSGGSSYPLATPGLRVRANPANDVAVLVGVFNGNPAGPGGTVPQLRDPSGTAFRFNDGVFVIGEAQYNTSVGQGDTGLPGTYKLGGWYNSEAFRDQRRSSLGTTLAGAAAAAGSPALGRNRRGDWSLYGIADQLVWRDPGTKDSGIGVFARAMGVPGDRNLVNFYADAGVSWKGALPGRPTDTAGLAFGFARISDTASKLDSDVRIATASDYPIRRNESVLELTYQALIAPWWQVQPTLQYVFNINGGITNPQQPSKRVGDAAILGLRTGVTF